MKDLANLSCQKPNAISLETDSYKTPSEDSSKILYVEAAAHAKKSNSPGLGPERVRSPTFCFCCNICYVCLTTFTISAIIIVYCSDNCCLLFTSKQWAREGGCQGAPGLNHCSLFHLLGAPFSHSLLCTTICSKM